jgi:glutamine---fructose-6-phosphate transaminase (isomerizing)
MNARAAARTAASGAPGGDGVEARGSRGATDSNQGGRSSESAAREALWSDVGSQGAALREVSAERRLVREMAVLGGSVAAYGRVLLSGMGASLYACDVAAAAMRPHGVQALTVPASELAHYGPRGWEAPIVMVSQSGASAEVLRVAEALHGKESLWCLTLNADARVPGVRSVVMPGGTEVGYAATRSFTTTVAALGLLISALTEERLDVPAAAALVDRALERSLAPTTLGAAPALADAAATLASVGALVTTARGPLVGLAAYAALIYMELCGTPAFALEAGMLRHGPVEAFGPGLGLVAFRTADHVAPLTGALVSSAHGFGSPSVVIETEGLADEIELDHRLRIPGGRQSSSPLEACLALAVPYQVLALAAADACGRTPGANTRGSKVTTRE